MSIGIGNLLNMFLHNGETNTVKAGVLHRSDPPQAILVEGQADLEHLGEVPAGSIAYTAGYGSMWQLSAAGSWEEIQEEGGSGGGSGLVIHQTVDSETDIKTMDKTWQEIHDAVEAGSSAVLIDNDMGFLITYPVAAVGTDEGQPQVIVVNYQNYGTMIYSALSASGYPSSGNPK